MFFRASLTLCVILAGAQLASSAEFRTATKLETPRRNTPRGGGPLDAAEAAIWFPDDVKVVRGAVLNPFYLPAFGQQHWREFAELHDFAVVGMNLASVRKTEMADTLQRALAELAAKSEHPEIAHLPLCLVGMSAGGGMCITIAESIPDQIIACGPVCLQAGPRSEITRGIPVMTVIGERDGGQLRTVLERLPEQRTEDALWSVAVQWRRQHEFGQANNILFPFFSAVIESRLPKQTTPAGKPVPLKSVTPSSGVVRTIEVFGEINPNRKPESLTDLSAVDVWLPNDNVAAIWTAFCTKPQRVRFQSPAGLGDKQEFVTHSAGKPIDVVIGGNETGRYELFDGGKRIATGKAEQREFQIMLPRGVHSLIAVRIENGEQVDTSRPHTIIVK